MCFQSSAVFVRAMAAHAMDPYDVVGPDAPYVLEARQVQSPMGVGLHWLNLTHFGLAFVKLVIWDSCLSNCTYFGLTSAELFWTYIY